MSLAAADDDDDGKETDYGGCFRRRDDQAAAIGAVAVNAAEHGVDGGGDNSNEAHAIL